MTGLILAWLVGEGIMTYRIVTQQHRPPLPAEVLGTSGLFAMLALLGEAQPQVATYLAWGFNVAAFLNLWPTTAKTSTAKTTTKTTTTKTAAA